MAGNPINKAENSDLDAAAMLPPLLPGVAAGSMVAVRGGRWLVQACVEHTDCQELHLRAADGESRVLLWPFDRPTPDGARRKLRVTRLAVWARRAGATLARTIDPRLPRGAFHGDVLPYQLAPAIAIASGVPRVLLADEVGLGKTVQAGWILADLIAREPDARTLIAVPAGLCKQWSTELSRIFSLDAACVDAAWLRAAVADRPADISPWAAPGIYLGSIDFLKRTDVAQSLAGVTWDLIVADEAHGASAPTDRHAMLARVAARARRIVMITATPFSGDAAEFTSILTLGARPGDGEPVMFRRSRDEVGDGRRRRHRFTTVRIGRAESRLQRLLERYTRDVWHNAATEPDGAQLAMTILRKRALSSPAAALRSLVRRQELLRGVTPTPRQPSLFDEEAESDDALPEAVLGRPGLSDAIREQRWLTALVEAAGRAAATDSKARLLRRLVARLRAEPIIVFTEYRDTLRALAVSLPHALQLHGGLTAAERAAAQRQFNECGGILLATDAAAEGLNLQQRCRMVVNYELPWNPARLEQRIGRVDRIGQRRAVHAISLVARDTAEDLVVAALARRLASIAATLGECDRLASLLSETRTARCVIAGVAVDLDEAAAPALPLRRPSVGDYPTAAIAAALRCGATAAEPPLIVSVAALRAGSALPTGVLAVVRAAIVSDSGVVAEQPFVVHLADGAHARPWSPGEARLRAASAIERIEPVLASLGPLREWFEGAAAVHRAALAARLARERWLQSSADIPGNVQPGLFDRRALVDLERRADAAEQREREHERRLQALAARLDARLECTVMAVLLAWR
jgi:superfamily II DNA or RNA helicase